jgi:putative transposase
MEEVTAWQNCPLKPCYLIVLLDLIGVKTRSDRTVSNTTVLMSLAILPDGTQDVLNLWFQANQGAKFSVTCATGPSTTSSSPP